MDVTILNTMILRPKNTMLRDGLLDQLLGEEGWIASSSRTPLLRLPTILGPELLVSKKVNIGSLQHYEGYEVAEMWSRAIGRTASMCGNDDDDLLALKDRVKTHTGQSHPSGWGRDLRLMQETFGSVGSGVNSY
jgi:hypothetical protein